jgi:hypothetical protein
VREPVAGQDTVTCIIPGHHRLGCESFSDSMPSTPDRSCSRSRDDAPTRPHSSIHPTIDNETNKPRHPVSDLDRITCSGRTKRPNRSPTEAVTLHVEEEGTGAPALVFLHYWGGSARTWTAVMDRLASTNRCVAVEPVSLLAEHVVARIAGAALEVISDSGHLIPLEQPQQVADRITAFVDRLPQPPVPAPRRAVPRPNQQEATK